MARKSYKPEEIVLKLRQVDVLHSQGMAMVDAIRQIGVSAHRDRTQLNRYSKRTKKQRMRTNKTRRAYLKGTKQG